ncbi:FAD-dependent monooxygenase [Streptosporangium subroseum]|uniref:FAD-dependent monooxygenase n=1 Tax=Streptosporangium subroseum TaxID=106412 RepID=UPI0030922BB5|nr:FAD-dependent monooxygenase [Streptosporangium subroseum]
MSDGEILVIGGGIGGLTAALAIARSGRAVRVLERAPEFAEIGAGLQLAPNATRLLDRLGVLDACVEAGVLPERLVFNDALTGARLTHLDLGEDFRRRYGGPYVVMHRSDLLRILVEACRTHGVALENGRGVDEVTTEPGGVTVTCADGSRHTGVLAVAADGLRSGVRGRLSDDQPIDSGYVAYRGTIPMDEVTGPISLSEVVVWFGPGLHLVQYPLRSGRLLNQVAVFRSPGFAAGDPDWGNPDELDAAFSVTCEPVRMALPSLWRNNRWPMYDREPLDNWLTGRTVLLGDAAHPMLQYLAQGACQAIEDGVSLADSLDRHLTDAVPDAVSVDKALHAYQDERIPRTSHIQRTARVWGDMWHIDGVGALLRNEVFTERAVDDYRHVDPIYGA